MIAALAVAAAALAAVPPPVTVPRHSGPVVLDARLEESAWRSAVRLTATDFTRWVADTYTRDPNEFQLRLFHDARHLYGTLVSYDRFVENDVVPENSDGLYAFSIVTRAGPVQHYRLRWSANPPIPGGEMIDPGKWAARLRDAFASGRPGVGGGYVLEFAIPLDAIGWRPGETFAANIIVQDHDAGPGKRYNDPGVEYARFAFGTLDNEQRTGYRRLRLAP